MTQKESIANLRQEYTLGGLRRADLDADPMAQFSKWLEQALWSGLTEPTAMTLATADKNGRPSSRIVLLKIVDESGFTFFTNYDSRKGHDLAENPQAALTLFWPELQRQVNINGTVIKVSREISTTYFNSRPKGSRLAAWVSSQSEVIADRSVLEKKLAELTAEHSGDDVPLPPYWGGYCVAPTLIEFWQGRPNRLHDRFRYLREPGQAWILERLSP